MLNINGGFPPIKYCKFVESENKSLDKEKTKKERFFSVAPTQNINIRQLLSDEQKKPIIPIEKSEDTELDVVASV